MAYNYPVYRAPSVPKLNKTNISSPLKGNIGRAGLQINKSKFSFTSPPSDPQNLSPESQEQTNFGLDSIKNISESLVETNRILVEIQNQLALDFSSRIVEDKKQLGQLKKQKSKKAFADKEAALESIKNIGSGLFKQVNKVLTPAKSLFQKIIDFFKTILTGIIVNNLLTWLSKDENKQKVKDFFGFLVDHWQWILGLFVASKLLGPLITLIGIVRKIKKVIDLLRGKGKLPGGGGAGSGDPCSPKGPLLQCMGNPAFSSAFVSASIAAFLANKEFNERIEDIVKGKIPVPTPVPTLPRLTPQQQFAQSRQGTLPGGYNVQNVKSQQGKFTSYYPDVDWGAVRDWGIAGAAIASPLDAGVAGDVLAIANLLKNGRITIAALQSAIGKQAVEKILSYMKSNNMSPAVARSVGGVIPALPIQPQKKKCNACALGFSQGGLVGEKQNNIQLVGYSEGGSVGGPGSGTVDSVPAMLAPGEYVIRTAASKLFRPLLSDINENAGRLWNYFREAVIKLTDVSSRQIDNSERFSTILEDLNNTFKQKKQRETIKRIGDLGGGGKGGGFGRPLFEKAGEIIGTQQGKSTGIPGGGWVGGQYGRHRGGQTYDNIINKIPNINLPNINAPNINVNLLPPIPLRLSAPKQTSTKSQSKSSPTIIPINLPAQTAPMPQINVPQGDATFVPEVSAVNMANPYMTLTPSLYGIFV